MNKPCADLVFELERQKEERILRQRQDKAMSLFIRSLKKNPQALEE